MSEPHSTITGIAGSASLGVSSVQMFMGAQVDALVIGLIGAVFVSIWLETIDDKVKAGAAVLFAAMLAGYGSPVAAQWVAGTVPSVSGNSEALRCLLALVIGAAAPSIVPLLLKYFGNKVKVQS